MEIGKKRNKWTIDEYVTTGGQNLVMAFLSKQTGRARTEAIALLNLLQERGNRLRMPHSKPLGGGLFELRRFHVRIFYMFRSGRRITLLDGMVKKQDQIPPKVLGRVRQYQKEIKAKDAEATRGP